VSEALNLTECFICLLICGLFNNAMNSPDYITSNVRIFSELYITNSLHFVELKVHYCVCKNVSSP
jgi:hypothetical protein